MSSKVCSNAVLNGHFNILIWVIKCGCKWNSKVCFNAASNGYLNIIEWAKKHKYN